MADQSLCSALTKISNSGDLKDLKPLYHLLRSREEEKLVDVPLSTALQVSERCVAISEANQTPE
jgi:hypothetical protein